MSHINLLEAAYSNTDGCIVFRLVPDGLSDNREGRFFLSGSFNVWAEYPGPEWQLRLGNSGTYFLEKTICELQIPGNSGYPEFQVVVVSGAGERNVLVCETRGLCVRIHNNILVADCDSDTRKIADEIREKSRIKTLSEFNLLVEDDRKTVANFRSVCGIRNLFRSYHPVKLSFPLLDTERVRSTIVKEEMEKCGIGSVVCLSGAEELDRALGEERSIFHSRIRESGHEMCLDTSYEIAYYHTGSEQFGRLISDVIRFVLDHPAPFLVHCRLGSDRTGVVCAVLAALCGASWNEIAADYEKTSLAGFGEYRDSRLLAYSLGLLAGSPVNSEIGVQQLVRNSLCARGWISVKEVDRLKETLL